MKVPVEPRQVIVYTSHHRIVGDLPVPPEGRVSDRLNLFRTFVPIRNARVESLAGDHLFDDDVVLVNKAHVLMVLDHGSPSDRGGRTA